MKKILFLISLIAVLFITFKAIEKKCATPGKFQTELSVAQVSQNFICIEAADMAIPFNFAINRFVVQKQRIVIVSTNEKPNFYSENNCLHFVNNYRASQINSHVGLSSGGKGLRQSGKS